MANPQVKFINPNAQNFPRNIMYASALCLPEIEERSETGTVIIAGSGPSLRTPEVLEQIRMEIEQGAKVFACKAAVQFLHEKGFPIHYSANIDPGQHIPQRIAKVPGCIYLIASSSDPVTFNHLLAEPANDVRVFHSACGMENEEAFYSELFANPTAFGGGYNVVNRAFAVALYMGFDRVVFAGLDSGWRDNEDFYCNGNEVKQKKVYMRDGGKVDGRMWNSTPDMLASAVAIAKIAKKWDAQGKGEKLVFLGDVLPAALRQKTVEYLNSVAKLETQPEVG